MTAFLIRVIEVDQLTAELHQLGMIHKFSKVITVFGAYLISIGVKIHNNGTVFIGNAHRFRVHYLNLEFVFLRFFQRIYA